MTALAFRRATETDMQCVLPTFLDSTRAAFTSGLIQMADWREVMEPQARKLFARPGMQIIVACIPDEEAPYDIYGWLAHETGHPWPMVVYCYVKHAYRGLGIARRLFGEAGIDPMGAFRHATWMDKDLAAKVPRARWSPLTVRFERREHVEGKRPQRARADQDRGAEVPADRGRTAHAGRTA